MDTSIKLAKYKEREHLYTMVRGAGNGAKELTIEVLRNPVFALILANVAIEALQRVQVNTYVDQPGTHAKMLIKQPLLSQAHATTLETIINSSMALTALSDAMGGAKGITSILGALK